MSAMNPFTDYAPSVTDAPATEPARPRPVRRSPADLPFKFADRGLAEALAAERGEPAWLRAERVAALEAFEAMPVETNQLYTPYVDLRGAVLDDARPYVRTASEPDAGTDARAGNPPDGTSALIELTEDRVSALALGDEALEAGASLAMASIQDLGPRQVAFHHRHATIGEAATLHWALAQLGGRLVRSRVDNRLAGDRSSVEQVEIVFGGEEQLFDLTSYTRHIGRDTTGNLLSKGALMDRARSYMKGMITIEKSAVGTDSFLGEFGMNLSKATRSVAIPSLEIDQPDCRRAAHASSVGPIDETQLFYLESRGIPPDEARKFIVLGFLEPVVARVPLEDERERLRGLLGRKWDAGRDARQ